MVPHITDAIQEWVERVAKVPVDGDSREPDVCIVEVIYVVMWSLLSSRVPPPLYTFDANRTVVIL